jgi:hypothetical protein
MARTKFAISLFTSASFEIRVGRKLYISGSSPGFGIHLMRVRKCTGKQFVLITMVENNHYILVNSFAIFLHRHEIIHLTGEYE